MNNVNAIFDAIGNISKSRHLMTRHVAKISQIDSVQSERCGNCDHWMKSSCVPEKQRKEFKSAGSPGCKDFALSYGSNLLLSKFKDELREIKAETTEWLEE